MDDEVTLISRTDRVLRDLEDDEVERLNGALDSSYLQLERELLRKYPNYTAESKPGLLGTQRGVLLVDELKDVLTLINPEHEQEIEQRYQELMQTSSKEGTTLADELIELQRGDDFVKATATIPIEAAAVAARESVNRLKKHDQKFREDASNIIIQGLIQGMGARRVATSLRQQLGATKGRAEAIARTEILNANNTAVQQRYKDAGYEYFQFIATADDRLCPFCAARNMQVYKLGESKPPIHPRCRCYSMPWSPEQEETGQNDWTKEFRETAEKELAATGKQVDNSPTYFERAAGLATAPKPVWGPGGGYADKDVERRGQNWAIGLLALGLIRRGTQPTQPDQPPDKDNELLKTLLIGAAIAGVTVGSYYLARSRVRAGYKQSAKMASDLADEFADLAENTTVADTDQITLVIGGFNNKQGRAGLEQAEEYQKFLDNHAVVGITNPNFETNYDTQSQPVQKVTDIIAKTVDVSLIQGRNPDAVRMAAAAIAFHRKHGKYPNLVGYSGGALVVREAHEILKAYGAEGFKSVSVAGPWLGFEELDPTEHIDILNDADLFASLPQLNGIKLPAHRQFSSSVEAHELKQGYLSNPEFEKTVKAFLGTDPDASEAVVRKARSQFENFLADVKDLNPRDRYRKGFKKSAQMAEEMAAEFESLADDLSPDDKDEVSFVAGGFAGLKGQAGLEYAEHFQEFLDNHLTVGVPTPEFDTDIDLRKEPLRHLAESYSTIFKTIMIDGRNPSAVRMAAMAYAYHKKHGKPINLVGYSGGGFVAGEAAEILKLMGVPTKVVEIGAPYLGITDLSPDEHITLMGKGDVFANLPIQNGKILDDVRSHWLDSYVNSPTFIDEIRAFLNVKVAEPQRRAPRPTSNIDDESFVDFIPQLLLLGEDELQSLPPAIAQKLIKARQAAGLLPGRADPKQLRGLPDPKALPGYEALLALPEGQKVRGLLTGQPPRLALPPGTELGPITEVERQGLQNRIAQNLYKQARSQERGLSRLAAFRVRQAIAQINQQNLPPAKKLEALRKAMFDEVKLIASPVSVRPPGTANDEDLTRFEFGGIDWHAPGALKQTSSVIDLARKMAELDLPDELIRSAEAIFISKQKSANEVFWRKKLKLPTPKVPATINLETNSITLHGGRGKIDDLLRQMGYLTAYRRFGQFEPPKGSDFWKAAQADRPTTVYGMGGLAQDFADSVKEFFLDPDHLKRFSPERYEAIAKLLNYRHPDKPTPTTPRITDARSPQIIDDLRTQNANLGDRIRNQRDQADATARQQRGTKKVQQSLDRTNAPEVEVEFEKSSSQIRVQEESINRLEQQVEQLEQRSAQILNPLNKPYFSEAPAQIKATQRQLKSVERELSTLGKIGSIAAKVRGNVTELQQILDDLTTRRETLKATGQSRQIEDAIAQLQGSLDQAEQELVSLPRSAERSQAIRDLQRMKAAINAQSGGATVADLHRQALEPRIRQLSVLADNLGGLEQRLNTSRNKLSDLQQRLTRLPQRVAELPEDQQQRYAAIKRTRNAQGRLPQRVEAYRNLKQQFNDQLAQRQGETQQIADNYSVQRQASINNVQAIVQDRLETISTNLQVLSSLRPGSIAWLVDSRNWESGDMPNDLAIVLQRQPGQNQTDKLKAAADYVTRLVGQAQGAINTIEQRLDYPNQLSQQTLEQIDQNLAQWREIRDALADEGKLSDRQLQNLLKSPERVKAVDVMRYGNQLTGDLEQFNSEFVDLLLTDEAVDPRSIIDQSELYRRARENFVEETAQTRARIAQEIEDALAIGEALKQRTSRDQEEALVYEVNGRAMTLDQIRAELQQAKDSLQDFLRIPQVQAKVEATAEEQARQQRRQQELTATAQRQQRLQTLRTELTEVNREIQKRNEARDRGQRRGISTDRLEAQKRRIARDIENLAREFDGRTGNDGES